MIDNKAYERGLRIILNPSPFNDKLEKLDFNKINWLLVNEVEAEQFSGCKESNEVWERIHDSYPELSLLITLGSAGSVAWRVQNGAVETAMQKAFQVNAVDTTAAGDTYTGYFVASLIEQRPLKECMRRASMASALSVTRLGAASSIPEREETEVALKSIG